MLSLATVVILALPGLLVWALLYFLPMQASTLFAYDWTPSDQEYWKTNFRGVTPAFVLKDVVEQPCSLPWLLLTVTVGVTLCCTRPHLRRNALFFIIFGTMFVVRCMGSLSGLQHFKEIGPFWFKMLPWDSASPFKGLFLFWIIQWPIWDRSYLSFFADTNTPSLVPMRAAGDKYGNDDDYEREICFRDAMIRLAYYHVIDNTLHVIWLRYFWPFGEGGPYTEYFNNSEAFHIVLVWEMIVWSILRMCETNMTQNDDAEKGMDVSEMS